MKHTLTMDQVLRLSNAIAQLDKPEMHEAIKPSGRASFRLAKNQARLTAALQPVRQTYETRERELKERARAEQRVQLNEPEIEELAKLNRELGCEKEEVELIAIPLAEFTGTGSVPGLIRILAELDGFMIQEEAETP